MCSNCVKVCVENVEKIAAVPGIAVLFIGPFDLSKQMGVVRGSDEHEADIERILAAAHACEKKAAIFVSSFYLVFLTLSLLTAWVKALVALTPASVLNRDSI